MQSTPNYPNDCLDAKRRSLEVLVNPPEPVAPLGTRLRQQLLTMGKFLVNALTGSQEPRIWSRRRGEITLWFVYDPYTQQQQHFTSEADLRSWLDQRYYQ